MLSAVLSEYRGVRGSLRYLGRAGGARTMPELDVNILREMPGYMAGSAASGVCGCLHCMQEKGHLIYDADADPDSMRAYIVMTEADCLMCTRGGESFHSHLCGCLSGRRRSSRSLVRRSHLRKDGVP